MPAKVPLDRVDVYPVPVGERLSCRAGAVRIDHLGDVVLCQGPPDVVS